MKNERREREGSKDIVEHLGKLAERKQGGKILSLLHYTAYTVQYIIKCMKFNTVKVLKFIIVKDVSV